MLGKKKQENEIARLQKASVFLDLPDARSQELKDAVMRQVLLTEQAAAVPQVRLSRGLAGFWPRLAAASLSVVLVLGGSLAASARSLPGDWLYPVKQTKEQVELKLAPQGQTKALVLAKHAQKRLEEISALKQMPKQEIEDHQEKAVSQASAQVSQAVESLSQIRQELEKKGDASGAESVEKALGGLVERAKKENIKLKNREAKDKKQSGDGQKQDKEEEKDIKKKSQEKAVEGPVPGFEPGAPLPATPMPEEQVKGAVDFEGSGNSGFGQGEAEERSRESGEQQDPKRGQKTENHFLED